MWNTCDFSSEIYMYVFRRISHEDDLTWNSNEKYRMKFMWNLFYWYMNFICGNFAYEYYWKIWFTLRIFDLHPPPPSILYILLKVNAFQVLLILGWSLLVFLSLMIALANQKRKLSKQGSTRLRKAFHVLTLLVFVPGLVYDARLLFSASWVAMGVMIIVEVRKGSKKNQQSLLWFQKNYPIWQIY